MDISKIFTSGIASNLENADDIRCSVFAHCAISQSRWEQNGAQIESPGGVTPDTDMAVSIGAPGQPKGNAVINTVDVHPDRWTLSCWTDWYCLILKISC